MGLINRKVKNMNKTLWNKPAFQVLPNTKFILTLTSFNDLVASDEDDMQNQNGILTLTCLNGLFGSDTQDGQNEKGLDKKTTYHGWG